MTGLSDSFQRPINYLRISLTDRCNLRCTYCMPPGGVPLIPHESILTYEEMHTIVKAAAETGINKVRLTGGEPLVRAGLPSLIRMLAQIKTIDDISMTTNGTMLARYAEELKAAGLHRVNVSLDSLEPEKFRWITRGNSNLEDVMDGIKTAKSAGLNPVKINVVAMAGVNDDEITDFAAKTVTEGWNVRFIELMPVNGDVDKGASKFLPVSEIRKRIETLGILEPSSMKAGSGPAKYFRLPGATGTIGFITPLSEHFCFKCNRLRLTADGKLRPCLLSEDELDLRQPLRGGASSEEIKQIIKKAIEMKPLCHRLSSGNIPQDRPFSQVGG